MTKEERLKATEMKERLLKEDIPKEAKVALYAEFLKGMLLKGEEKERS